MLNIQREGPPPTLAEVIEALQSSPSDMVCMHLLVEFEPRAIPATPLSEPRLAKGCTVVQRIELTLERRL